LGIPVKVNFDKIAKMSDGFTGADIKEVIDDSIYSQLSNGSGKMKISTKMLEDLIKKTKSEKLKKNDLWTERVEKALKGESEFRVMYS
ncbi:MAG: hypothetical protein ACTSRU_09015, partial [Candidatus Hodarchaeales archaeon]